MQVVGGPFQCAGRIDDKGSTPAVGVVTAQGQGASVHGGRSRVGGSAAEGKSSRSGLLQGAAATHGTAVSTIAGLIKADSAVVGNGTLQAVGRSYQRTGIEDCAAAVGVRATEGNCSRSGLLHGAGATHGVAVGSIRRLVQADITVVGNGSTLQVVGRPFQRAGRIDDKGSTPAVVVSTAQGQSTTVYGGRACVGGCAVQDLGACACLGQRFRAAVA